MNLTVDCEGKSDIQNDSCKSRPNTLIETKGTLVLQDMGSTSHDASKSSSFKSLEVCLDDINRVVEHDRAETSKTTSHHINKYLPFQIVREELLSVFENDESHTLVSGLSEESGEVASVNTS